MPFNTRWIHNPYILQTEFSEHVSGGDFTTAMLEYLGAAQEQPTYFLLDFTRARHIPARLFELSISSQVINHANTRWFVIVNPDVTNYETRMLARSKVKVFPNMEMAIGFLRAMVRLDTGQVLTARSS